MEDTTHNQTNNQTSQNEKNIVLVGFGGAGKTTIGRYLATRFDREFADVDEEISKVLGYHHDQYIKTHGWEAFRTLEREVVQQLAQRKNVVIACGGGTVIDDRNIKTFHDHDGKIFFIDVPYEELLRRTRSRLDRPVANAWSDEEVSHAYHERLPGYSKADASVYVNGCNVEESADRVMDAIFAQGFAQIPYELWFRKPYLPLLEQQAMTTAIRPGNRKRPNPKGTSVGEDIKLRLLDEAGNESSLPRFNSFTANARITSIDVKTLEEITDEDLVGTSPDASRKELLPYHLGLIYNRALSKKELVSVIKFSY